VVFMAGIYTDITRCEINMSTAAEIDACLIWQRIASLHAIHQCFTNSESRVMTLIRAETNPRRPMMSAPGDQVLSG
jgi:hypothetical protein